MARTVIAVRFLLLKGRRYRNRHDDYKRRIKKKNTVKPAFLYKYHSTHERRKHYIYVFYREDGWIG